MYTYSQLSYLASLHASDRAYISAHAEQLLSDVLGCLLLRQNTGIPFNNIITPVVLLTSPDLLSPAWSESL